MTADTVRFVGPLRVWRSGTHGGMGFLLIEGEAAEAIGGHELVRRLELGRGRGFGSVKVMVSAGASRWPTSVFPTEGGGWFLPVKKAVRRAEDLAEGDEVEILLELL
jgi:hypothetical protein